MPIYEYQCETCKRIIEVQQSMSEAPLESCPTCAAPVKKLISRSSFQLKGGGWYSDGYSSSSCGGKACSAGSGDSAPSCPTQNGSGCGGCC